MAQTTTPLDNVIRSVRPWGEFEQFVSNERSTTKIITVAPGQRLSLQRHVHRDELWHVIDGPVHVVVGSDERTLATGERVFVPRGTIHRMGNPGAAAVRVLEVAFGDFDEDDIERLEDDYSREAQAVPST
ncbi:MAG: phosphomannose isomerase type II C-terminal cupin domain [Lapillicoccus sp.]